MSVTEAYLKGHGCIDCKYWKHEVSDIGLCKDRPFSFTSANEICEDFTFKEKGENQKMSLKTKEHFLYWLSVLLVTSPLIIINVLDVVKQDNIFFENVLGFGAYIFVILSAYLIYLKEKDGEFQKKVKVKTRKMNKSDYGCKKHNGEHPFFFKASVNNFVTYCHEVFKENEKPYPKRW